MTTGDYVQWALLGRWAAALLIGSVLVAAVAATLARWRRSRTRGPRLWVVA